MKNDDQSGAKSGDHTHASHLLGRESEAHCLDQRLDDRGGLVAHDVRTEQSPVFWSATSLTIPVVSSVAQP
jgi:hypothetical protein